MQTYDMEERLLAQMLFTGSCAQMDSVFELYMKRKQTRESMVKAYFTQKCIQYFLEGKEIDQTIFGYLKNAVNASLNKEKIPNHLSSGSYPVLWGAEGDGGLRKKRKSSFR